MSATKVSGGSALRKRFLTTARHVNVARIRDYVIVSSLVLLFVFLSFSTASFLTFANLSNVLDQSAPIGIVACAATLVIIAGGFDLSVGAVLGLTGLIAAIVSNHSGPVIGMLTGLLAGLVLGVLNGFSVAVLRVNSFIATLASTLAFRGLAVLITGGFMITVNSEQFKILGTDTFLQAKYTVYVFAAVAVVTSVLLTRTSLGRQIKAVGGNPEAARIAGIRVGRIRVLTFALSGLSAGIAGVLTTSRIGIAVPNAGVGLELNAIAAVVLGGTSILGGEGAIWRTITGVLLLALIGNGFNLSNVSTYYQPIVSGALILAAVAVDAWSRRRVA